MCPNGVKVGSAGECDRQAVDTGFKRKLKAVHSASFQSTEQLTQAIEAFVARYNETAAPFVWRKREVRGAQLRNTIVNLRN